MSPNAKCLECNARGPCTCDDCSACTCTITRLLQRLPAERDTPVAFMLTAARLLVHAFTRVSAEADDVTRAPLDDATPATPGTEDMDWGELAMAIAYVDNYTCGRGIDEAPVQIPDCNCTLQCPLCGEETNCKGAP